VLVVFVAETLELASAVDVGGTEGGDALDHCGRSGDARSVRHDRPVTRGRSPYSIQRMA
jgi:hypothetical protein